MTVISLRKHCFLAYSVLIIIIRADMLAAINWLDSLFFPLLKPYK